MTNNIVTKKDVEIKLDKLTSIIEGKAVSTLASFEAASKDVADALKALNRSLRVDDEKTREGVTLLDSLAMPSYVGYKVSKDGKTLEPCKILYTAEQMFTVLHTYGGLNTKVTISDTLIKNFAYSAAVWKDDALKADGKIFSQVVKSYDGSCPLSINAMRDTLAGLLRSITGYDYVVPSVLVRLAYDSLYRVTGKAGKWIVSCPTIPTVRRTIYCLLISVVNGYELGVLLKDGTVQKREKAEARKAEQDARKAEQDANRRANRNVKH